MEDKEFVLKQLMIIQSQEIARKFQIFFAHMEQFCQQFLKGQNAAEFRNDKSEKKKERDPNAPKRPLTAFFLFNQKYREKVLERNPEVKLIQISQMAGQKWNSMSEEEKQPYIDQYNEAKNKYEEEIKDYNEKQSITNNDKKRKKQEKFDDKSVKSGQDYHSDDIDSESIQPAIKHQQQLKQQQQQQTEKKKVIQTVVSDDDDDQIQQGIQSKPQQSKLKATKPKNKQNMDDDLQREIIQVINNDKSQKKSTKK
ncbi:unnamed protein product [Paramecium sonneborni]|uniref:HMG box domain-containing protein n=1 Tax=Paramecium sonneborni TaxID=65129 RepID=A0A8S1L8S9_9CILI|nr:unnamed protein product [Paramecium sonneborni]